jgi:hypothetical protein
MQCIFTDSMQNNIDRFPCKMVLTDFHTNIAKSLTPGRDWDLISHVPVADAILIGNYRLSDFKVNICRIYSYVCT